MKRDFEPSRLPPTWAHWAVLRAVIAAVLGGLLVACESSGQLGDADTTPAILNFAYRQHLDNARSHDPERGFLRRVNSAGIWETTDARGWTSGFFAGVLWHLHEFQPTGEMEEQARRWTEPLAELRSFTGHHDLGFMVLNSFGHGYRLTGDEDYKEIVLDAARSLASRFNPTVGAIRSWDIEAYTYPVIIDNMMNLELLFWAAKNGGDEDLYDLAVRHALTSRTQHVRPDGSTFHVVDFNPSTGEVITRKTQQGYADSSTWARGQAWGLYGFTMTYRETRDERFLETAERIADWFIANLPEDHIPYWDFDVPNKEASPRDASAASIAASGLLELSQLTPESVKRLRYRRAAEAILSTLSSDKYLARGTGMPSVLLHSVGDLPRGTEIDVPIIYAEYYFIEALLRTLRPDQTDDPAT